MWITRAKAVGAAMMVVSAMSCGDSDSVFIFVNGTPDTLTIVVVDGSVIVEDLLLEVGDTARLDAEALNALGLPVGEIAAEWHSTNPTVASVNTNGDVAARAEGIAEIVAAYENVTATVPTIVSSNSPSSPSNVAPTASITSPSQDTTVNLVAPIAFRGSANDVDGTIASHRWTFGDGSTASVEDPGSYAYENAGTYSVSYRVTDDDGAPSAIVGRTITVIDPSSPPPPSEQVLFYSDWSTATGTSTAAVRDANKARPWSRNVGQGTPFEVRSTAAAGRDYPTTNFIQVNSTYAELTFQASDGYIPTPAVGESIYLRMYYRLTLSGTGGDTHGTYFDDDPVGGVNWGPQALGIYIIPSSGSTMTWLVTAATGLDPIYFSPGERLDKNRTYRIELRYTRTGTNTYTLGARIYDVNGALLYGESAFQDDWWYDGSPKLQGRTFTVNGAGAASMRGFKIGVEASQGGGAFAEHAGIAICRNDWCGPYPIPGVEN